MASITTVYPENYRPAVYLDPLALIDFDVATFSEKSSTAFTIDVHNNQYVLTIRGSGFRYAGDGQPTQGVITEIHGIQNGTPTYDIEDVQISVASLTTWLAVGGPYPLFAGDDIVMGGSSSDTFFGYDGHDVVSGGPGADHINGGAGNDHIYGQSSGGGLDGPDTLSGDEGSDYLQGNAGDDRIDGGAGSDRINGGSGNDFIFGGSGLPNGPPAGNDTVNGNLGDDTIIGDNGNDSLRGGQGNDQIQGGDGNDVLMGDKGNDVLSGGRGYDLFTGGEGSDVFRFDDPRDASAVAAEFTTTGPDAYRVDIVTDFHHGEDHLAFSTPQNILVGAATDAQAAATLAQTLLDNNPGDSETAAIGVGHDTYLFFHLNSSTVQAAVLLIGVNPGEITASDFGF